jgi:hypothetical protein
MIHNLIFQLGTIKTGPSIVAQPRNYTTGQVVSVRSQELAAVVALRSGFIPQRRPRGP